MKSYFYEIDERDVLVDVDAAWLLFARECGAAELGVEKVLGRSLWEFVSDVQTISLYVEIFARARASRTTVVVPFRCDGPEVRRFMELSISPGNRPGNLALVGRLLRTEHRPPVALLDPLVPRSESFVRMCSWCKKVQVGEEWLEVETAVSRLELFGEPVLPQLNHGICDSCQEAYS
jgi:hypothetical protein